MIEVQFPDGNKRKYESGTTGLEIATSISVGLAQRVLSASYNDQIVELTTPLLQDGVIELYTWNDQKGKQAFWHSSAHVLAQVLLEQYPSCKLTIGPPIDQGFYYDAEFGDKVPSAKDFEAIEKRFLEIARQKFPFVMRKVPKKQALSYYKSENNPYKVELIEGLEDDSITFCDHSDFTDLCKGGHVPHTGYIKSVKLLNVSGAFWRADQTKAQLTRIYGITFPKQKELKEYLKNLEEAKKRDHRVLGKQLSLFTFSKSVGVGLPLWLPDGADLRFRLEDFMRKAQEKAGYQFVVTPHIGNKDLYITSGHFQKYGQDSFGTINSPDQQEEFLLKPMNCPHHCEIYKSQLWSYKDLPVRYAEFGTVYRYEQSGELHGLTRVRGFTQDDAHIFCTPDQLNQEFKKVIDLILYVFRALKFNDFTVQVSVRDPNTPEKYIGSDVQWNESEQAIIDATQQKELDYSIVVGEAAFYGPKLDFMVRDVLKRPWQLGTIQVDYNLPDRFDLQYTGSDNRTHRPIMIHRAPFGSLERFIAILIEHTAGDFPLWLAPTQVQILCVGENHKKYAQDVAKFLENNELRARVDDRSQTIGKKIREAEITKVPYMLIIGDKEAQNGSVSVRKHKEGEIGNMSVASLVDKLRSEIEETFKV